MMIEPMELSPSRIKMLGLIALSTGFVAIAVFLPDDGGHQTWRWLGGVLFGLCLVVFLVLLVRPQRVALDREGFTISGGFARSSKRVRWRDVDGFFVRQLPRGGKAVAYSLCEQARPDGWLGDLSHRMGADGMLPRALKGSPATIADELNAYRQRALKG